ncbi:MAG: WXG100 family type VII secretion target [Micromonosporaceae bacterium]|nr:WXG100 family type VII secretion target [Micromonosporaceae bacterium]
MGHHTNFDGFHHSDLWKMLHDGNPDEVTAVGDAWDNVTKALYAGAGDLMNKMNNFKGIWSGEAATAYENMISDLVNGVNEVATGSQSVRDLMYNAADALRTAQAQMPDPVDVAAAPAMPSLATMSGWAPAVLNAPGQTAAVAAAQQQAAATAQAQAARVMGQLADTDVTIDASMPQPPLTAQAEVAADGTVIPGSMGIVNPDGSVSTPLFSRVFTDGLAAAGAAAAGLFGTNALSKAATNAAKVGGGGIPGLSGKSIASPALAAGGAVSAAGASSLFAGAGSTAASTTGAGFVPAMGYGAAGMEDGLGGGKRIPPWLVETEDVWGEQTMVAPSIIGDELPVDPTGTIRPF